MRGRVICALRRFDRTIWADALGCACLWAGLIMGLFAPLLWGEP